LYSTPCYLLSSSAYGAFTIKIAENRWDKKGFVWKPSETSLPDANTSVSQILPMKTVEMAWVERTWSRRDDSARGLSADYCGLLHGCGSSSGSGSLGRPMISRELLARSYSSMPKLSYPG
jgi:hypothetical protein